MAERTRPPSPQGWALKETLALLILLGLPAFSGFSVFGLSQLRLAEVVIEGPLQRVPRSWVEQQVATLRGRHLLLLSLPAVSARLARHPWVAAIEVKKELPHSLRLVIAERRPAALRAVRGEGLVFLDDDGRAIAPLESRSEEALAESLPVLRASRPDDLAGALGVSRAARALLPGLAPGLIEVSAVGGGAFAVRFAALPYTVIVSGDDAAGGFRRLDLVLPEVRRRYRRPVGINVLSRNEVHLVPADTTPLSAPGLAKTPD